MKHIIYKDYDIFYEKISARNYDFKIYYNYNLEFKIQFIDYSFEYCLKSVKQRIRYIINSYI